MQIVKTIAIAHTKAMLWDHTVFRVFRKLTKLAILPILTSEALLREKNFAFNTKLPIHAIIAMLASKNFTSHASAKKLPPVGLDLMITELRV